MNILVTGAKGIVGRNLAENHMLPGYTHNLINLSDTENLVTVMWANEP